MPYSNHINPCLKTTEMHPREIVSIIAHSIMFFKDLSTPKDLVGTISRLSMSRNMNIMRKSKMEILIGSFQASLWPLWDQ